MPGLITNTPVGRAIFRMAIGRVFHRYFRIVPADTRALREEVFRIRYDVYCEELKFEDSSAFPDRMERDAYDEQSLHLLLHHKPSGVYAGCVRLVRANPAAPDTLLPFERLCADRLFKEVLDTSTLPRLRIAEISRLAVRARFRRRPGEQSVAEGVVPERGESSGKRKAPPIALGLYLAAAATGLMTKMDGVFALMEPRLARRLSTYGIAFLQVGEAVEHRGMRAPFYITGNALYAHISPMVRGLLDVILGDLETAHGWTPLAPSSGRD